jgi:lysophospholipase L1-like esterase
VVLGNEMGSFYEGPFPNHTIVRNNTIRHTQGTAIDVYTRARHPGAAMTHGVEIRDNRITVLAGMKGIDVRQARDVLVKGNVVMDPAVESEAPVAAERIRIVLVGDSTVTDQSGWGTGFERLVDERIACENFARGGRSSKSFIEEGHWAKALASGADYVLIQFGHNDMPGKGPARETDPNTTYRAYMGRYVDETRAAGAVPVLVTSMTRRHFRDGKVMTLLGAYAAAVRDLARTKDVPLVDLHAASIDLLNRLGAAESETLGPMVDGRRDRTHLSARGQAVMGALVADLLGEAVPELGPHLGAAAPRTSEGRPR